MSGSAGIVLAGGRSSRMGTPKAALEWHGSTLLRRTVGIISRVTDGPVVVVRAPGQALPALPSHVEVVDDPREGMGPVQGLAAGLAAIADRAEIAFVSSTDLPFLHPAFVRRVLRAAAEGADVGLPLARGYPQPLAASYRTALAPVAERLVARAAAAAGFPLRGLHGLPGWMRPPCARIRYWRRLIPTSTRWSTSTSRPTTRRPGRARRPR